MKRYKKVLTVIGFISFISFSFLISSRAESKTIQNLNIKVKTTGIESGEYI